MNKRFLSLFFLWSLFALIVNPTWADDKAETPKSTASSMDTPSKELKLTWLTAEAPTLLKTLSDPPAKDSAEDKADLAAVVLAQKNITPDQIAALNKFSKFKPALLTEVVAPDFATKYPVTDALLKKIGNETHYFSSKLKETYHRDRPYVGHPDVVKSYLQEKSYSYPSGHALGAQTAAGILSDLFPAKAKDLSDRAQAIAQSRINAGVHYPTDIAAGQKLGDAIVKALLANAAFQKDYAAAKAEVAAAK